EIVPRLLAEVPGQPSAEGLAADPLPDAALKYCTIELKSEVDVPAQDAGVLVSLDVVEGAQVRKNHPLGKIDDMEPQMQRQVAEYEKEAAEEQAKNNISVVYARAQTAVAKATVDEKRAANRKVRGTVTNEELRRVELEWRRAELSIQQAELDQKLAGLTAKSKGADVEAAEKNIERRQIKAPIDGEVVAVLKDEGEWVSPGDTILHIVNMETLRVSGILKASEYDPQDIQGRSVTVEVGLAHGRLVKVPGKVVYVSPIVQSGGEYPVWAEVKNRKDAGQWLLRPGLTSKMTIHMK
ncbi:MAG: efflux RND transporter periplasmic adaptor subunit, partial [Pirellulales bacterium]